MGEDVSGIVFTEDPDTTRFGTVFGAEITFRVGTLVSDSLTWERLPAVRAEMRAMLSRRIATEVESWLAGEGWKT